MVKSAREGLFFAEESEDLDFLPRVLEVKMVGGFADAQTSGMLVIDQPSGCLGALADEVGEINYLPSSGGV